MRAALLGVMLLACAGKTPDTDVDDTPEDTVETDDTTVDTEMDTDDSDLPPGDPCLAEPTVVRVGTGDTEYIALADRADVFMVHGPQGEPTWHVDLAVEIENTTDTVVIEHTLYRADGSVLSETTQTANLLVPLEGVGAMWSCDGQLPGLRAILEPSQFGLDPGRVAPWDDVCGVEIRADVTVSRVGSGLDDLIELATVSKTLTLQPDPCDCASCGVDTPVCEQIGTDACEGVPFVKWCERPPEYCPIEEE